MTLELIIIALQVSPRVRFFKKILNNPNTNFFSKQINPRFLGSWSIKGTKESTLQARRRGGLRGSIEPPLEVNNGGLKTQTVDFQSAFSK